jgi:hypothetical protein
LPSSWLKTHSRFSLIISILDVYNLWMVPISLLSSLPDWGAVEGLPVGSIANIYRILFNMLNWFPACRISYVLWIFFCNVRRRSNFSLIFAHFTIAHSRSFLRFYIFIRFFHLLGMSIRLSRFYDIFNRPTLFTNEAMAIFSKKWSNLWRGG